MFQDYAGNYTGPYWSDGKIQESVPFGKSRPTSRLDALSRYHDTSYALYDDFGRRTAADSIYNERARKLPGNFPKVAGGLVQYGNFTYRSLKNLSKYFTYGLPGLVYGAVQNMYNLNDYMLNEEKYKKQQKDLYASDPITLNPIATSPARGEVFGEDSVNQFPGNKSSDDQDFRSRYPPGWRPNVYNPKLGDNDRLQAEMSVGGRYYPTTINHKLWYLNATRYSPGSFRRRKRKNRIYIAS